MGWWSAALSVLAALKAVGSDEAVLTVPGDNAPANETPAEQGEPLEAGVFIDATACARLEQSALFAALRVEASASLGPVALLVSSDAMRPDQGLVIVDCDLSSGALTIEVIAAPQGRRGVFPLDVSDIPNVARPRTAAVAIVQWALALLTPPPAADRSATAAVDEERPEPPSEPAVVAVESQPPMDALDASASGVPALPTGQTRLAAGGQVRAVGPQSLLTRGGWLAMRRRLGEQWQASGQLSYETASSSSLLGDVRLHWVSGSIAGAYRAQRVPWVTFGVQLEVSDAIIVPDSRLDLPEPNQHEMLVLGDAQLEISVPLLGGWSLETTLAAGYFIRGVHYTAAGRNVFDMSRGMYLARVGLGHEL